MRKGQLPASARPEARDTVVPDQAGQHEGPPPQFHFPQQMGLGITRSTGNMIALLLHTEAPHSRASILAWVAKDMGIPLSEFIQEYADA